MEQLSVKPSSLAGTTIVFDLDGTLVDTAPDLIGATNHALARLDLPARTAAELRPWISFGARRMIVEALSLSMHTASETEIDALLEIFLVHYEDNIARESRPFPHVTEAMARLRQEGALLAVCTNKREALSLKLLDALQLTAQFAAIVGRDTLPVSKPHPGHLTGTIARAGGRTNAAFMVGDSAVDIATARAAGVPVIGVTFGYTDTPISELGPDIVLADYRELVPKIMQLATRT